jgi:hypothetical protein
VGGNLFWPQLKPIIIIIRYEKNYYFSTKVNLEDLEDLILIVKTRWVK